MLPSAVILRRGALLTRGGAAGTREKCATADPALAPVAEDVWRRLHDLLVARITEAIRDDELPAGLDAEREATRIHALIDGLVVHVIQAPTHAPPERTLEVVDHTSPRCGRTHQSAHAPIPPVVAARISILSDNVAVRTHALLADRAWMVTGVR